MKFLEERFPTEATYIFELTKSEITALNTVLPDLVDRTRNVVVDYTTDGSRVVPTELTLIHLRGIVSALSKWDKDEGDGHDYFDWWKEVRKR